MKVDLLINLYVLQQFYQLLNVNVLHFKIKKHYENDFFLNIITYLSCKYIKVLIFLFM